MSVYHAHCRACGAHWRVIPPVLPTDLETALGVMEKGLCPDCGNDGTRAPVNWRFVFWGRQTTAEIRGRETARPTSASGEGETVL